MKTGQGKAKVGTGTGTGTGRKQTRHSHPRHPTPENVVELRARDFHGNDTGESVTWATEGTEGYRKDRFYTRSTDTFGHKDRMQVNLPPVVLGRVAALVSSGKIPAYRTAPDFVRDAIMHRLHDVEEMLGEDEMSDSLRVQRVRASLEQQRMDMKELDELAKVAADTMQQALDQGDDLALKIALDEASIVAEELREPYAGRLYREIVMFRAELARRMLEGRGE